MEAHKWLKDNSSNRLPHIGTFYRLGAENVDISESRDEITVTVTFPEIDSLELSADLWEYIANCNHDGAKIVGREPIVVALKLVEPNE